jgi:hypothetical protein
MTTSSIITVIQHPDTWTPEAAAAELVDLVNTVTEDTDILIVATIIDPAERRAQRLELEGLQPTTRTG